MIDRYIPRPVLTPITLDAALEFYRQRGPERHETTCGSPSRCILALMFIDRAAKQTLDIRSINVTPGPSGQVVLTLNIPTSTLASKTTWSYRPLTAEENAIALRFDRSNDDYPFPSNAQIVTMLAKMQEEAQ